MTTEKIKKCIYDLTGLTTTIEKSTCRWTLKLGDVDPIEIGYNRELNTRRADKFEYSSHVKMLNAISQMLQSPEFFKTWINLQSK